MEPLDQILQIRRGILSDASLSDEERRRLLADLEEKRRKHAGDKPLVGSRQHVGEMVFGGAKPAMLGEVADTRHSKETSEFHDPEEQYGTFQVPLRIGKVIDADTVEASYLGEEGDEPSRVRLRDIDAPELGTVQGEQDADVVRAMIEGRTVISQTPMKQRHGVHGRELRKLYKREGESEVDVSRPYTEDEVPDPEVRSMLEAERKRKALGQIISGIERDESLGDAERQGLLRLARSRLAGTPTAELAPTFDDLRGMGREPVPEGLDKTYFHKRDLGRETVAPVTNVDQMRGAWAAVMSMPEAAFYGLVEPFAETGQFAQDLADWSGGEDLLLTRQGKENFQRAVSSRFFDQMAEGARDRYQTYVSGASGGDDSILPRIRTGGEGTEEFLRQMQEFTDFLNHPRAAPLVDNGPGNLGLQMKALNWMIQNYVPKLEGVTTGELSRLFPVAVAQIGEVAGLLENMVAKSPRFLKALFKGSTKGLKPEDLARLAMREEARRAADREMLKRWSEEGGPVMSEEEVKSALDDLDSLRDRLAGGSLEERVQQLASSKKYESFQDLTTDINQTLDRAAIRIQEQLTSSEALLEKGAKRARAAGRQDLFEEAMLSQDALYGSARSSERAVHDSTGFLQGDPDQPKFGEWIPNGEPMDRILADMDGIEEFNLIELYRLAEREAFDMPVKAADSVVKNLADKSRKVIKLNPDAYQDSKQVVARIRDLYLRRYGPDGLKRLDSFTQRLRDWEFKATVEPFFHVGMYDDETIALIRELNEHYADFTPYVEDSLFLVGGDDARKAFLAGAIEPSFGKMKGAGVQGFGQEGAPLKTLKGEGLGSPDDLVKVSSTPTQSSLNKLAHVHYAVEVQRLRNSLGKMVQTDPGLATGEVAWLWSKNNGQNRFQLHKILMRRGELIRENKGLIARRRKAKTKAEKQSLDNRIKDNQKEIEQLKEKRDLLKEERQYIDQPELRQRSPSAGDEFSSFEKGVETRFVAKAGSNIDRFIGTMNSTQRNFLQKIMDSGMIGKLAGKTLVEANSLFRFGVVGTPEFAAKNLTRDSQLGMSRALYGIFHPGHVVRGLYHSLTNSTEFRRLMNSGAGGGNFISGDVDADMEQLVRGFFKGTDEVSAAQQSEEARTLALILQGLGGGPETGAKAKFVSPFMDAYKARLNAKRMQYGEGSVSFLDRVMNVPGGTYRGLRRGFGGISEWLEEGPRTGLALKTLKRGEKGKGMGVLPSLDNALKRAGYTNGVLALMPTKWGRARRAKFIEGWKHGWSTARKPATMADAMRQYRTTTVDFSRSGAFTEGMNAISPFVNAEVQDVALFTRYLRDYPISTVMKSMVAMTLPNLVNWYRWYDDPDYRQLSASDRWLNFHLWKNPETGRFGRIPKSIGLPQMIFGQLPTAMMDWAVFNEPSIIRNFEEILMPSQAYHPDGSVGGTIEANPAARHIAAGLDWTLGDLKDWVQNRIPGEGRGSMLPEEWQKIANEMPVGDPNAYRDWLDGFFSQSIFRYVEPMARPALLQALKDMNMNPDSLVEYEDEGVWTLLDNLGIQATRPIDEARANRSFFFRSPIEPRSFSQDRPEGKDIYTSTTSPSMRYFQENFLSEVPGFDQISPVQLESVFRGYTGTFGGILLKMADTFLEKSGLTPEEYSRLFKKTGIGFTQSSRAYGPGSDSVSDFYRYYLDMSQKRRSKNLAIERNSVDRAVELYEDNVTRVPFKMMEETSKHLKSIWDEVKVTRSDTTLEPEIKEIEIALKQQEASLVAMLASEIYRMYLEDPLAFSEIYDETTGELDMTYPEAREFMRRRRRLRMSGEDLSPNLLP